MSLPGRTIFHPETSVDTDCTFLGSPLTLRELNTVLFEPIFGTCLTEIALCCPKILFLRALCFVKVPLPFTLWAVANYDVVASLF
jgi:hypothetical protein